MPNNKSKITVKVGWFISFSVSFVLTVILILLWKYKNEYEVETNQLINEQSVQTYLDQHWNNQPSAQKEGLITIKTGIFIQSLEFYNTLEVNLTGYIWQRYKDGLHDAIKPDSGQIGFIFPEQVKTGEELEPYEAYRSRVGDEEVIGYYFEATLRQDFDYFDYPFDHKTVWIRLWPKQFARNIILVPDFEAYDATGKSDEFGIDQKIVLTTWERENTYFNYRKTDYDTNFGIVDYVGQKGFPELYYNFVIKRKFSNAFIVHLLPLFLVATLLFAGLMTLSADDGLANRHGFNTSAVIGACSALFFVVLLAHIQLREQFSITDIVYLEYFYFLMYAFLVFVSANTYFFIVRFPYIKFVHYRDNLIPKILYWPVLLLSMVLITWITL